jgi:hypothetical protein
MVTWLLCLRVREHAATSAIFQASHYTYSIIASYLFPISNYKQKSLYGFRMSTLVGWVGGDSFKYGHRLIRADFTNSKIHVLVLQNRLLLRTGVASTVQDLCYFSTFGGHWWVSRA